MLSQNSSLKNRFSCRTSIKMKIVIDQAIKTMGFDLYQFVYSKIGQSSVFYYILLHKVLSQRYMNKALMLIFYLDNEARNK